MQRRQFVASLVAAIAATGAYSAISRNPSHAQGKPKLHIVRIADFVFAPDTLAVHPGDRIRWVNDDIVPHTATATDESWDTGEVNPSESGEIVVTRAMAVSYYCRFHPMMKANLRLN